MGSGRITNKDVSDKIDTLNEMFKNRGIDVVLTNNPRNGYAGVDYVKNGNGCMDFICGVSTRECYNQLSTAIATLHLMSDK